MKAKEEQKVNEQRIAQQGIRQQTFPIPSAKAPPPSFDEEEPSAKMQARPKPPPAICRTPYDEGADIRRYLEIEERRKKQLEEERFQKELAKLNITGQRDAAQPPQTGGVQSQQSPEKVQSKEQQAQNDRRADEGISKS